MRSLNSFLVCVSRLSSEVFGGLCQWEMSLKSMKFCFQRFKSEVVIGLCSACEIFELLEDLYPKFWIWGIWGLFSEYEVCEILEALCPKDVVGVIWGPVVRVWGLWNFESLSQGLILRGLEVCIQDVTSLNSLRSVAQGFDSKVFGGLWSQCEVSEVFENLCCKVWT